MFAAPFAGFEQNIVVVGTCKMLLDVFPTAQFEILQGGRRTFSSRSIYKILHAFFVSLTLATCPTRHRLFDGEKWAMTSIFV
jgi:hypothetical protein